MDLLNDTFCEYEDISVDPDLDFGNISNIENISIDSEIIFNTNQNSIFEKSDDTDTEDENENILNHNISTPARKRLRIVLTPPPATPPSPASPNSPSLPQNSAKSLVLASS